MAQTNALRKDGTPKSEGEIKREANLVQNRRDGAGAIPPEQIKANASKGGKARAKRIAQRKSLKESMETLLYMPIRPGKVDNVADYPSMEDYVNARPNVLIIDQICMIMTLKAMDGDIRAFQMIMEIIGEKPPKVVYVDPKAGKPRGERVEIPGTEETPTFTGRDPDDDEALNHAWEALKEALKDDPELRKYLKVEG